MQFTIIGGKFEENINVVFRLEDTEDLPQRVAMLVKGLGLKFDEWHLVGSGDTPQEIIHAQYAEVGVKALNAFENDMVVNVENKVFRVPAFGFGQSSLLKGTNEVLKAAIKFLKNGRTPSFDAKEGRLIVHFE